MKELKGIHKAILKALSLRPEGISLKGVHEYIYFGIDTPPIVQNTHQMLSLLIKKGYAIKRLHLYFLANEGASYLNQINTIPKPTPSGVENTINESIPTIDQSSQANISKAQRMHAITGITKLYPTSFSRIEATLSTLKISYKKVGISPAQYIFSYNGLKMRASTRKLTIWGKEINAPINLNASDLGALALKDMLRELESFLDKTNLKVQRSLDGQAVLRMKYWEIAFTDNEIARKATEKNGYIPLAFDRNSGIVVVWADNSYTPEFETNRINDHKELRQWTQGIQDGIIKPYDDELRTRRILKDNDEILNYAQKLLIRDRNDINELRDSYEAQHQVIKLMLQAQVNKPEPSKKELWT